MWRPTSLPSPSMDSKQTQPTACRLLPWAALGREAPPPWTSGQVPLWTGLIVCHSDFWRNLNMFPLLIGRIRSGCGWDRDVSAGPGGPRGGGPSVLGRSAGSDGLPCFMEENRRWVDCGIYFQHFFCMTWSNWNGTCKGHKLSQGPTVPFWNHIYVH